MDSSSVPRRDFVAASTGVAAGAWLVTHAGVGEALAYAAQAAPPQTRYAALAAADRVKVMEGFEKDHGGEFGALLFPTMAGMFTNPSYGGNANKVGWALMGFTDQFSWKPPFGYYDRA